MSNQVEQFKLEYFKGEYQGRPVEFALKMYEFPETIDVVFLDTEAAITTGEVSNSYGVEVATVPYHMVTNHHPADVKFSGFFRRV